MNDANCFLAEYLGQRYMNTAADYVCSMTKIRVTYNTDFAEC